MKRILKSMCLWMMLVVGCKTPVGTQSEDKAIGRNNPPERQIMSIMETKNYVVAEDLKAQLYNMSGARICFGKVANFEGTPDALWLCDASPLNSSNAISLIPTFPNGSVGDGDWALIEYHKAIEKDGKMGGVLIGVGHATKVGKEWVRTLDILCTAEFNEACGIDSPVDGQLTFSYGSDYKVDLTKKPYTAKARPRDPTVTTYRPAELPRPVVYAPSRYPTTTYGPTPPPYVQPPRNPRYSEHLVHAVSNCGTRVTQNVNMYVISTPCLAGNRVNEHSDVRQLCNILLPGSRYVSESVRGTWFDGRGRTTEINAQGSISTPDALRYMSQLSCIL